MGEIIRDDNDTGITMLVMLIIGMIIGALGYRMYHYYDYHISDNDCMRHEYIGFDSVSFPKNDSIKKYPFDSIPFTEKDSGSKKYHPEKNLNPPQPQNITTYDGDPTL